MAPLKGSVSWTGKPVSYYLHVIDRTKVSQLRSNGISKNARILERSSGSSPKGCDWCAGRGKGRIFTKLRLASDIGGSTVTLSNNNKERLNGYEMMALLRCVMWCVRCSIRVNGVLNGKPGVTNGVHIEGGRTTRERTRRQQQRLQQQQAQLQITQNGQSPNENSPDDETDQQSQQQQNANANNSIGSDSNNNTHNSNNNSIGGFTSTSEESNNDSSSENESTPPRVTTRRAGLIIARIRTRF
ncbi:Histone-lysine N-methyltransferase, H3 lysine-79 specific [Sarracenia purpurea var. burkii]